MTEHECLTDVVERVLVVTDNPEYIKVYKCTATIPTPLVDLAEAAIRGKTLYTCTDIDNTDEYYSFLLIYTRDKSRTDIIITLADAMEVPWNKVIVTHLTEVL